MLIAYIDDEAVASLSLGATANAFRFFFSASHTQSCLVFDFLRPSSLGGAQHKLPKTHRVVPVRVPVPLHFFSIVILFNFVSIFFHSFSFHLSSFPFFRLYFFFTKKKTIFFGISFRFWFELYACLLTDWPIIIGRRVWCACATRIRVREHCDSLCVCVQIWGIWPKNQGF